MTAVTPVLQVVTVYCQGEIDRRCSYIINVRDQVSMGLVPTVKTCLTVLLIEWLGADVLEAILIISGLVGS